MQAGLDQAQMLVVPDISDMFLPLNDGFLVDPIASREIIEGLLDSLPKLYANSNVVESAMTGPLKATMMALVRCYLPMLLKHGPLTDRGLRTRRKRSEAS